MIRLIWFFVLGATVSGSNPIGAQAQSSSDRGRAVAALMEKIGDRSFNNAYGGQVHVARTTDGIIIRSPGGVVDTLKLDGRELFRGSQHDVTDVDVTGSGTVTQVGWGRKTGELINFTFVTPEGDLIWFAQFPDPTTGIRRSTALVWVDASRKDAAKRLKKLQAEYSDQVFANRRALEVLAEVRFPTAAPILAAPPAALTVSAVPMRVDQNTLSTVSNVARSGPRHALIVANARYTPVLGSLPNPVNDGRLVAGALRAAGFQVEVVTDADQRTMKQAIARLGSRLAAAGKGATGLFYYAGHGVQARGVNYLLPVNAEPRTEADVDLDGVAADNVLKQMEDAGAATNIVILDACRDMPLARGSRTASRGLVRMEAPNGSYLAYSTAPGQTATDGGGANSPFATALAAEIARPNQPIEGVFRNVRRAVSTATGGKQTPWDASSLFDSFVFTAK